MRPWLFLGAMPNPSLGCFLLVGCCLSCFFFGLFWGAMPNPSLGCFLLVGCCLSCLGSFVAFFGGDAKSLAWVFLARRVLPFVFGFFFGLFWGGDAKSLAWWVFLARRVLTKWMVMGSVYLELFEAKPCCILVCTIIPYVLWNAIFVVPKCPKSVKISPV